LYLRGAPPFSSLFRHSALSGFAPSTIFLILLNNHSKARDLPITKFKSVRIMSVYILLRYHAKLSDKKASDIILTYFIDMDASTLNRYRKQFVSKYNKKSKSLLEQSSPRALRAIAGDYIEKMRIADLLKEVF